MKLPVSRIPTLNQSFYLISYSVWLNIPPTRRSNRAHKPRVPWEATIIPPRRRAQPAFTIFTESSNPSTQHPEHPTKSPTESLTESPTESLTEGLDTELSDDDLSTEFSDEDPDWDYNEDPNWGPDEGPDKGPDEGPNEGSNRDPDTNPNEGPIIELVA